MNKSENIEELAGALALAWAEAENASKNAKNPHFRSAYADLAEVINTVRPVLAKHGISFLQAPRFENGLVTVETMLMHKSGQWMSSEVSAPATKGDAQGVGAAITYCRRYGLSAMCGIAQEDDDANAASRPAAAQYVDVSPILKQISEAQTHDEARAIAAKVWNDPKYKAHRPAIKEAGDERMKALDEFVQAEAQAGDSPTE